MNLLTSLLHKVFLKKHSLRDRSGRIERESIMMHAFEFVAKSGLAGCYMEFGTYQGASFVRAYHAFHHWSVIAGKNNWPLRLEHMYAFDSFEGLPALEKTDDLADYQIFAEGQYAFSDQQFLSNLKKMRVDLDVVDCIKGFYDTSLKQTSKAHIKQPAAIIHIDVDLYSSCIDVMRFITDFVQDGTLILFDDYYCYRGHPDYGVRKAYDEWLVKHPHFLSQTYTNYGWSGKAFIINLKKHNQA